MTEIFLKLLNMSIAASWLVLAVIALRFLLKKAPKWSICLLWGIVALRLVMPFSLESVFSLIPSPEVFPQDMAASQAPVIYSGIPAVNSTINPLLTEHFIPGENALEKLLHAVSAVWLGGMAVMLLYSAFTYGKLRWQLQAAVRCDQNVYICDNVDSPFLLGIFRPRIYIPSGMEEGQLQYVLAHENAHIRRRDHWWKPLGYGLLTVYWFNPLLWLAYSLLCRDIERACDEKVVANMDSAGKKGYSRALLECSVHRRTVMACPVAFGEVDVKTRIVGVLSYKKPAFWIILASCAACVVMAVCFLTNPKPCAHDYHGELTMDATCTEPGVQMLTCQLCGHSYTAKTDVLAHAYDEGIVTTEPSCTHTGSRERTCTGCGAVKTEQLAQSAHIPGGMTLVAEANCTQTGKRETECTVCHAVCAEETLQTNENHDLHETVLREATCEAPGEGRITCSRCDHVRSRVYEPLGHSYEDGLIVEATCRREGQKQKVCAVCGDEKWSTTPKSSEHMWKSSGPTWPSSCMLCGMIDPDTMPEPATDWPLYGTAEPTYPTQPTLPVISLIPPSPRP